MLLSKSDLLEKKEEENRGLSRCVEDTEQQLKKANREWKKVTFNDKKIIFMATNTTFNFLIIIKEGEKLQKEKEILEKIHADSTAQLQAQVESGKKQNLDLIQKSQELEVELETIRKKNSSEYHIFTPYTCFFKDIVVN